MASSPVNKLRLEISSFKDEWGFITPVKNPPMNGSYPGGGNILLFTGLYYAILSLNGAVTQVDSDEWIRLLSLVRHEKYPIYWRTPVKKNADDHQEHDDYWGILAASFHCGEVHIPAGIHQFGKSFQWSFDIQQPEKWNVKYWFARFPMFVPFVRLCCCLEINLFQWFILYTYVFISSFSVSDSSSNIRAFLVASVLRERSLTGRYLFDRLVMRMKGGLGFIGELPPDHPLVSSI